jgi:hypothetical protein
VELVKAAIEAYIAGDRGEYLDFYTEDIEGYPDVSRFPEARPFRGREEFRRFLAEIEEGWEGGASTVISEPGWVRRRLGFVGSSLHYRCFTLPLGLPLVPALEEGASKSAVE